MKSIFKATYQDNEIMVVNTWFNGEKLFVNGFLQDHQLNFLSANLTGHLIDTNGEKLNIKANLFGHFSIDCKLFINNEKVDVIKEA